MTPIPDECTLFLEASKALFAGSPDRTDDGARAKVVETIFAAVIDGADRFRYLPTNGISRWLPRGVKSSESEHIAEMRSLSLPKTNTASRLGGLQNEQSSVGKKCIVQSGEPASKH